MNKAANIKFITHLMLGHIVTLAEIMLADKTQPPNVRAIWLNVQKSASEAMSITLADLQVSVFDQGNVPQQAVCIR